MYIVIFCSLIALLLTYLESRNQAKGGMKWGFVIVTILGMIHYDYGNDYMFYYDVYKQVTSYRFDLSGILGDYYREPGWALLCWLFKPIGGFFMMVAVLNLIQNMLVYRTINNYVEKKWWPLSVFIYNKIYKKTKNPYISGMIMGTIACILAVTNTLTGWNERWMKKGTLWCAPFLNSR